MCYGAGAASIIMAHFNELSTGTGLGVFCVFLNKMLNYFLVVRMWCWRGGLMRAEA